MYTLHFQQSNTVYGLCSLCGLRVGGEHETVTVVTEPSNKLEMYCLGCYVRLELRASYYWGVKLPFPLKSSPVKKLPAWLVKDGKGVALFRITDSGEITRLRERNQLLREKKNEEPLL